MVNGRLHERSLHSRRRFIQGASGGLAAGLVAGAPGSAARAALTEEPPLVRSDGTYDTVPLRSDEVTLTVVQSRVKAVDGKNPGPGKKENLDHMLWLIDTAQHYGGRKDILAFHEFPITGWDTWTRDEIIRLSLELPGEETEAIGKKAKEHNCYVTFGTYAKDEKDWPGHFMSISVVIAPTGEIVSKQWKARNIHFPGFALMTTTVYDVLDRYVEMYGWDAVLPVARTDVGNIAVSPIQWEFEFYRALAMKGTEIMLHTSSGGFNRTLLQSVCRSNGIYGAEVNNSVSPGNPNFAEDSGGGGDAIWDPRGRIIAEASTHHEEFITATLPMASFRKRHRIPDVHKPLYAHVYDQYQSRYPPNAFLEGLPESLEEAAKHFDKKARW